MSICYFVAGYGCISIGQSGNAFNRFHSTLNDKCWANRFLWVNLKRLGIRDATSREHLEALMIFRLAEMYKWQVSEFSIRNIQYTCSLGRFSGIESPALDVAPKLFSAFMNFIRSDEDPRGKYNADAAIWHDTTADDEARRMAAERISTIERGIYLLEKSNRFRCLELRKIQGSRTYRGWSEKAQFSAC